MLLSLYLGLTFISEKEWEIRFPCDITSWLGLEIKHPSLFGYSDISNSNQLFISAFPLSDKIYVVSCKLKDIKGSCIDALSYLNDNKISILRTDVRSLSHVAYWEAIVELDKELNDNELKKIKSDLRADSESIRSISFNPIYNFLPTDEKKKCIINYKQHQPVTIATYSGGMSCLKINKSSLSKLCPKIHLNIAKKAVLGTYTRMPVMVINFYDRDARLVEFSYEMPNRIGAFNDTIKPITEVCSIIGLNATSAYDSSEFSSKGICSGIFHLRKDKIIYDLNDTFEVFKNKMWANLIRRPTQLHWKPANYEIFLYGLRRYLGAKWKNQNIGSKQYYSDNKNESFISIRLTNFEIPDYKAIDVIFTMSENEEIIFDLFVPGMPKGVGKEEADKSEKVINNLIKEHHHKITREFS
jgi:hypothetical protein